MFTQVTGVSEQEQCLWYKSSCHLWLSTFQDSAKLPSGESSILASTKLNSVGNLNLERHHCFPYSKVTWIYVEHWRIILSSPDGKQIHAPLKTLISLKYVSQWEVSTCCLNVQRIKEDCMHTLMATFTQQLWEKWIFSQKTTLSTFHYQFNYSHSKMHSPLEKKNKTTLPLLI